MTALYNENDDYAADWLENLIRAELIAPGVVDRRSIVDLTPDDLLRHTQVHLFAGIGIWSAAARDAGVRDDELLWSASCPCQPFSAAGKGGGFDDERHLWPALHWLIEQCEPERIVGEQVASKDGLAWLDLVQADMEGAGYAFGATDTCAAGFGAPHIRQRLYWTAWQLADPASAGRRSERPHGDSPDRTQTIRAGQTVSRRRGATGLVVDADHEGPQGRRGVSERADQFAAGPHGVAGGMADACSERLDGIDTCLSRTRQPQDHVETSRHGEADGLADAVLAGRAERGTGPGDGSVAGRGIARERPGPTNGFWRDPDWLLCRDGKWRPVEAGTFPLAHGQQSRVGKLRAYGNQIVRPQAAAFIEAALFGLSVDFREVARR